MHALLMTETFSKAGIDLDLWRLVDDGVVRYTIDITEHPEFDANSIDIRPDASVVHIPLKVFNDTEAACHFRVFREMLTLSME
jgi:hypothetical protein